ncbi:MAG: MBL fold metallo-hydrolase [Bacteroidales bacterium]|nr:MBL fold metallo-hydrolase [Bacteroidales bacterium]
MKKGVYLLMVSLLYSLHCCIAQQTVITCETGDFRVSTLSDGGRDADPSLLVGATPEILEKCLPNGSFPLHTHAFLIHTPDKNILIDAGVGKNLLSKNLPSLDISVEQIHVILLTHMHGDHIGGLMRDGKKAFPQAELYVSQAEYDYWMGMKERGENVRKTLDAYRDKLHLFVPGELGKATADLVPGIKPVAAYGHTPGHTAYLVESAGKKLLVWGDLTHAVAVQMPHPEVALSFDVNPQQAVQTRKRILDYVQKNGIRVAGAHIPFPAVGDIEIGKEGGYGFTPLSASK